MIPVRELAASSLPCAAFAPQAVVTLGESFKGEKKAAQPVVRVVVCLGWRVLGCCCQAVAWCPCPQGSSVVLGDPGRLGA